MDELKELRELVCRLEEEWDEGKQIKILQDIGAKLLTEYEVRISDSEIVHPLRVEAYYYPYQTPQKFEDPCAHPSSKKIGAFGKLYFIECQYGYPGVDICLSNGDYYLSFLIKNSYLGDDFYKQMDLFDRFQNRWQEIEQTIVLRKRATSLETPVFNTSRVGLKEEKTEYSHGTKFAHKLLASVIDIQCKYDWEKCYGKEWTVANYLVERNMEPTDENIKEVLGYRSNGVKIIFKKLQEDK